MPLNEFGGIGQHVRKGQEREKEGIGFGKDSRSNKRVSIFLKKYYIQTAPSAGMVAYFKKTSLDPGHRGT